MSDRKKLDQPELIQINPNLVWDYDIPPVEERTDGFIRWYLSRVLTRGNSSDLKTIGMDTIYKYFPLLNLPADIRQFWLWYFSLPEVKMRYGPAHSISTASHPGD